MARALLMPDAHSSILKPGGTLSLLTGISAAGSGAGGWAIGASGEPARSAGWPCFHDGGAAGRWAWAGMNHVGSGPSSEAAQTMATKRRRVRVGAGAAQAAEGPELEPEGTSPGREAPDAAVGGDRRQHRDAGAEHDRLRAPPGRVPRRAPPPHDDLTAPAADGERLALAD